ncbi:MAG: response regulator [Candidatus Omnitrophica bacterium]|nr:response regulator [Candidatus Omnitrophota bacterium]
MDKKKILVIDDDPNICELFKNALESEGYKTSLYPDGKEGLASFEKNGSSLILLDLQMPNMDGFEMLSKIRERDKEIPVIVITGFGTVENAVRALKSGATDFLVKPLIIQDLLFTVKRSLESGMLTKEISKFKMIEAILELNRVLVSLTSLDLLLDRVVSIMDNIFQPEKIAVYIAGAEEEGLFLRKNVSKSSFKKGKSPLSFRHDEVADIFRNRKARVEKTKNHGIKIPLCGKEKAIGFIDVEFPEGREIKEEEIKFLEVFAIQVGIGIENANLFDVVKESYLNSIRSLVNSLEAKDAYTKGHSEQVAYYSCLIGREMELPARDLEILRNASYLHDLGKLGIKDSVLLKPGPLDRDEIELIRQHPSMTIKILEPLGLRKEEIDTCFYHHERINGKGYPAGLKGEEIPFFAKILSVADAYSAMVSERPYRKGLTKKQAVKELEKWAGIQFDRDIVNVFLKILSENETGEVIDNEGN